jgi:hypothetical protein
MNRYFSTPPVFSAPVSSVDRAAGVIHGVTIARTGPAKGHGGFIDKEFLLQIVEDASLKSAGVKARFGHPNMCNQALGNYLGRFKNYSYSGNLVKADLYLDETAKNSPSGDLYSYVLNMAEKNPDMFGASIVFEIGESVFLQEEVNGQKTQKEYFRLKELRATDIVDEPAATNGLFSANTFPGIATQFLDENPEILELILSKPDSITEFLTNYLTNSKMTLSEKIKEKFTAFMAQLNNETQTVNETEPRLVSSVEPKPTFTQYLFNELVTEFPDAFEVTEGLSDVQMAESVKAFFSAVKSQLEESETKTKAFESAKSTMLILQESMTSQMQAEIDAANTRISALTEQLSARPSIPLNVTDPALSTSNTTPDETGKQILAAMPKDMKRKLSSSTKTTE